jgi:hypothetical protein
MHSLKIKNSPKQSGQIVDGQCTIKVTDENLVGDFNQP